MATPQSADDNVPVRQLRARRDSTPVPTELVDAANPLAIAFHASASLGNVTDVIALGNYWGAGRRKAREAREVLIAHGLWIKVRPDVTRPNEIRTVETRVTDRDIAELALEYPAGARISTAGCTWVVDTAGRPVLERGVLPTDFGLFAGQDRQTETGPTGGDRQTETGLFAGQDRQTETGPTGGDRQTETGLFAGQDRQTETGPTPRARINEVNSFLPEGRKEGINEGATPPAGAGAGDAAPAGKDDELTAKVRDLVRRLPWSKTPVGRTAAVLREADQKLVPAIVTAIREHGISLDDARDHALARWRQVRSVGFLIGAFEADRLTLPEPDDALDLPAATSTDSTPTQEQAATSDASSEVPAWCGDCMPVRTDTGKRCSSDCTGPTSTEATTSGGMPEHVRAELHARREQERLDRIRRLHGYSA